MLKDFSIRSWRGEYKASFHQTIAEALPSKGGATVHYIVDRKVADLYAKDLAAVLSSPSVLLIDANEPNKSLEASLAYVDHLVARGLRRDHLLCAIGGGVVQDITCFLASILLRGVDWILVPTTLLAQCDSGIGSKSSINVRDAKNLIGGFWPPKEVRICTEFLKTLSKDEIRSGVGEMLKVHVLAGANEFDRIATSYEQLFDSRETMIEFIGRSLAIKKRYIEEDEFDRGIRNVLNYGHSFGHAIESMTDFAVPHGIAVTIGMDMANFTAWKMGLLQQMDFVRMHNCLKKNYRGYEGMRVDVGSFIKAMSKDKKNQSSKLGVILPQANSVPEKMFIDNTPEFQSWLNGYFAAFTGGTTPL